MDGPCLSQLLKESGQDLRIILRAIGVSRKTWNDWLWGVSEPTEEQRKILAEWLFCSADLIDAAIARNSASWNSQQKPLLVPVDENAIEKCRDHLSATEVIIQIIVSVVTSVIVTLQLLGEL